MTVFLLHFSLLLSFNGVDCTWLKRLCLLFFPTLAFTAHVQCERGRCCIDQFLNLTFKKNSFSYEWEWLFSFNISLLLLVKNQINKYTVTIMKVHLGHEFQFIFNGNAQFIFLCKPKKSLVNVCLMKILIKKSNCAF